MSWIAVAVGGASLISGLASSGSKDANTSTASTQPSLLPGMDQLLSPLESGALTAYNRPADQAIAPLTQDQTNALSYYRQIAGGNVAPALNGLGTAIGSSAAGNVATASAGLSNPGSFDSAAASKYMSPYLDDVLGAGLNQIDYRQGVDTGASKAKLAGEQAFGSRGDLASSILDRNQADERNNFIANTLNTGYTNAQGQFNADANRDVTANTNLGNLGLNAGTVGGNLLTSGQNTNVQNAGLLDFAGTQQQKQNQAVADYPNTANANLAGILYGAPAGTNSTSTTPGPNPWTQAIGTGIAAYGAFAKNGGMIRRKYAEGGFVPALSMPLTTEIMPETMVQPSGFMEASEPPQGKSFLSQLADAGGAMLASKQGNSPLPQARAGQASRGHAAQAVSGHTFAPLPDFPMVHSGEILPAFADGGTTGNPIDGLYTNIFGRAPDAGGEQYWTNQLQNGESLGDIASAFRNSPEFQANNPLPAANPMQSGAGVGNGGAATSGGFGASVANTNNNNNTNTPIAAAQTGAINLTQNSDGSSSGMVPMSGRSSLAPAGLTGVATQSANPSAAPTPTSPVLPTPTPPYTAIYADGGNVRRYDDGGLIDSPLPDVSYDPSASVDVLPSLDISDIKSDATKTHDSRRSNALLQAGLAMLASRSPNFGVGIGEGGLAGLKAYQEIPEQDARAKLINSQARGSDINNELSGIDLDVFRRLNGIGTVPSKAGAVGAASVASPLPPVGNPIDGSPLPGAGVGASGSPLPTAGSPAYSGDMTVTPATQPPPLVDLNMLVDRARMMMQSPKLSAQGVQLLAQAQSAIKDGKYIARDGRIYAYPGQFAFTQGEEQAKAQGDLPSELTKIGATGNQARQTEGYKAGLEPTTINIGGVDVPMTKADASQFLHTNNPTRPALPVPAPGSNGQIGATPSLQLGTSPELKAVQEASGAQTKEAMDAAANAPTGQRNIQIALGALDQNPTGLGAEARLEAARYAKFFGADDDQIKKNLGSNITDAQILSKNFFQIAADRTRALGAREPGFVLQSFQKASPNLALDTTSNKLLLNLMNQDYQHQIDYSAARVDATQGNKRSAIGVENDFNKANPPEKYITQAYVAAGEPIRLPSNQNEAKALLRWAPSGTAVIAPDGSRRYVP